MGLDRQKIKIAQWVLSLEDVHLVSLLEKLTAPEEELSYALSANDQVALERSLAQADAGELIPHSKAMEQIRNRRLDSN